LVSNPTEYVIPNTSRGVRFSLGMNTVETNPKRQRGHP
jgi:hypothetical protein